MLIKQILHVLLATLLCLLIAKPSGASVQQIFTAPNPVFKSGVENSTCPNNIIEDAEQCDDNNLVNGDGCPSNCRLIQCGDGAVEPAEVCDDASISPIDGCGGEFCEVTTGWLCGPSIIGQPSSTSVCVPMCGDGIIVGNETCDQGGGNVTNGDGCSSTCMTEVGFSCVGTPSVCTLLCGNGVIDIGELCDGTQLGGQTCFGLGFSGGTLSCGATCQFNTSACTSNVAPVANSQSVSPNENQSSLITLTGSDIDSPTLVFAIVAGPSNGVLGAITSVSGTSASINFTPNANFVGTDSFTFSVNDGSLSSNIATVSINVLNVAVCGDSLIETPEQCDDAANTNGDGCSSMCLIENNYSCFGAPSVCSSTIGLVINELDYDNPGANDSLEFIEIKNNSAQSIFLSDLSVVLINGVGGLEYAFVPRVNLSAATTSLASPVNAIGPGQYLVIGPAAVITTAPASALRIVVTPPMTGFIQNGAPDGIAIVNTATQKVIDALSYEGSVSAAQITGFPGTFDLVEGTVLNPATANSNATVDSLRRFPDGQDNNDANTDWSLTNTPTAGASN